MKKILDPINVTNTGLAGAAILVLSVLANPQAQAALASFFTHPSPSQIFTSIGVLAGIILLYISKPILTSEPPKGP